MKEVIEEFKKQNGNNTYTQKEMLMYVVARIDKIDDRLDSGTGKIAENRTRLDGLISTLKIVVIVGVPILCGVLGYIFTQL